MSGEFPARVGGMAAARCLVGFVDDPIRTVRRVAATYGRFAALSLPLPINKHRRTVLLTVGGRYNREVLGRPEVWRTVSIAGGGPRDSAPRRLGRGLVSMNGRRHAHYRRLLVPPLRRSCVAAMGDDMARLAQEVVERWPTERLIDLRAETRRLMRTLAIGLLFADDREHGYPIAEMINQALERNWSVGLAACPINLPLTPFGKWIRDSERLEARIINWIGHRRAQQDPRDLLSIVVRNPDEDGVLPSDLKIAEQVPTLFGAAYETCQNALIWTLLLIAQHPAVAQDLLDELDDQSGAALTPKRVGELPLLDAVIKESMRILPPVPQQFRVALEDTAIADFPAAKGTRVLLSAFLTNRVPELFPEADRFRPERWSSLNLSPYDYSAFSGGPRICPGFWFGTAALKVAVAAILRRYRIALAPHARIDYQVKVALSPRAGVPIILHKQDRAFAAVPISGRITELVRFAD